MIPPTAQRAMSKRAGYSVIEVTIPLQMSTSLISVHSVSNSCPISWQCKGKHSKFIGLHKRDRKAGRGFGRELLTWDAFGHEMLKCSTQQNFEFVRLAVESL
jgi:hypothetical protein